MKTILVTSLLMFAALPGPGAGLDDLLDERIVINKRYKVDFVAETKGQKNAELLAKHEAGVGDAWLQLLAYAKASEDDKLKSIVLELEFNEELRNYAYDLEYAEDPSAAAAAKKGLQQYQEKLKRLKSPPS